MILWTSRICKVRTILSHKIKICLALTTMKNTQANLHKNNLNWYLEIVDFMDTDLNRSICMNAKPTFHFQNFEILRLS